MTNTLSFAIDASNENVETLNRFLEANHLVNLTEIEEIEGNQVAVQIKIGAFDPIAQAEITARITKMGFNPKQGEF
jgi:hypothetical protein